MRSKHVLLFTFGFILIVHFIYFKNLVEYYDNSVVQDRNYYDLMHDADKKVDFITVSVDSTHHAAKDSVESATFAPTRASASFN